jgi:CYTH domain-containing protein
MDKRTRYAKPEYERRFLLDEVPVGVLDPVRIRDRYLRDTRLRLRRIETLDGDLIELKLGHKWRPDPQDPRVILHTSLYLDETEFGLLGAMPGDDLVKTRYWLEGQPNWAVDVHESPKAGSVLLEVNFSDPEEAPVFEPPEWVGREVTRDETYTGAGMSRN